MFRLYELVKTHMIHKPCQQYLPDGQLNPAFDPQENHPCLRDDGTCSKGFPYAFSSATDCPDNTYAQSRRRSPEDGGHTIKWKKKDGQWCEIDNRWIVRYNPKLLLKYACHLNVEISGNIESVKYICGYFTKGHDMSCFSVVDEKYKGDEIGYFENGRFIAVYEALWGIYCFKKYHNTPAVLALDVHLENQQSIYWDEKWWELPAESLVRLKRSKLTAWFDCNADFDEHGKDPDPRDVLYQDFPEYFRWLDKERRWKRRQQQSKQIGRLYEANFRDSERWALRRILLRTTGARSYPELMMVPKSEDINFMFDGAVQREEDDLDGFIEEDSDSDYVDEPYEPAQEMESTESADDIESVVSGVSAVDSAGTPEWSESVEDEEEVIEKVYNGKEEASDTETLPESVRDSVTDFDDEMEPDEAYDEGYFDFRPPRQWRIPTNLSPEEYTIYDTFMVCVRV